VFNFNGDGLKAFGWSGNQPEQQAKQQSELRSDKRTMCLCFTLLFALLQTQFVL
jgi:hypothetical protein